MQARDYELAAKLSRAGDELLVGPVEIAALTGLSATTIGKRKVRSMPQPIPGIRRLLWRLGDIRNWLRTWGRSSEEQVPLRNVPEKLARKGRPTKAEEMARLAAR
jgi:hypothetical protein